MKKGLLGLSAFVFAATLVGCGADNKADNKDKNETTTVAEETTTSAKDEDIFDDDTDTDDDEAPVVIKPKHNSQKDNDDEEEKTASPLSIKDIAGTYHKNGHMYMGDQPKEIEEIDEKEKDDPITISEDGTLHLIGKDYKLTEEVVKGSYNVFGIEGSGFELSKLKYNNCKADKDYEGPCALVHVTSYMTFNGEKISYDTFMLYMKQKGTKECFGYIQLSEGEESDEDIWSFDWDDDDEENDDDAAYGWDENTTEE